MTALGVVGGEAGYVRCGEAEIDKLQVESLITETDIFKLDVAMGVATLLQHVPHATEELNRHVPHHPFVTKGPQLQVVKQCDLFAEREDGKHDPFSLIVITIESDFTILAEAVVGNYVGVGWTIAQRTNFIAHVDALCLIFSRVVHCHDLHCIFLLRRPMCSLINRGELAGAKDSRQHKFV